MPPSGIITLTTDFGPSSPYVAAMKGVMLRINPRATIVDLTHAVPPQDIRSAAWTLAETTPWFPDDTIHAAVVDPGVGTARGIVYARIGSQHYVCPDNGLLSGLAGRCRPTTIIAVERPEFWLAEVSATFHGRDIMAPVAAHLSLGLEPSRLGGPQAMLVTPAWPEVEALPGKITGTVRSIDSFGNLITDIPRDALVGAPTDERLHVFCDEHETTGLQRTYADQPAMTLVAIIGSSGYLELAIVEANAAEMLGIPRGAPVVITWESS
ncbi:MAG TPA: SAM-dependent chlorinase/fluorinase [Pirellulales bacterium]|nr:SAM-dependent chlorinase/fluorinase [Pirellulales bacterium]